MHALIVLAHPEPTSFNAQLAALAAETLRAEGYSVETSDLYAMCFDPCEKGSHYQPRSQADPFDAQAEQRRASDSNSLPPDVAGELEKVFRADLIIFQYPMWWFTMPAILKGWFDRVLVYGKTYTSKGRYDAGVFGGRRAMQSVTLGGPEPTFAYNGRNGDIDLLLWPSNMILYYVGYSVLPAFTAFGVEGGLKYSKPEALIARLQRYKQDFRQHLLNLPQLTPIPFNGWADWDENGRLKPGVQGHSYFMRSKP